MKPSRGEILSRLEASSRDNCINWRGSPIRSGDNILFEGNNGIGTPGQIIDIVDYRDIPKAERCSICPKPADGKTRMVLIRHRPFVKRKEVNLPDPVQYSSVSESTLEVADSVEVEWLPYNNVLGICFIFHIDTVQRESIPCKGMHRVFLIRFEKTRNGRFIPVKEKNWYTFYRDPRFPEIESYPEFIWNNVITLKMEVQRAMCRGGQWDGRTVSARILGAQSSFFNYLKYQLEELTGNDISLHSSSKFSRTRKVMLDSLAASRKRVRIEGELIRVIDEDELLALRKIFGSTFGIGITQPIPSLKMLKQNPSLKATVWLRNHDTVRIVSCSPKGEDVDCGKEKQLFFPPKGRLQRIPMKYTCSYRGLDIRFNRVKVGVTEINVQCRFLKVRGDSLIVNQVIGRTVDCSEASDSDSSCVIVSTGDYITLDGPRVYKVKEVTQEGMVRCVSPINGMNEAITISMDEAITGLLRQCS
jgi:hypothetical protein